MQVIRILRDEWHKFGKDTNFFIVQPCDMTSLACVQQTGKERFSRSAAKQTAGMNGYRSEQEEQSSTVGQICCLVEDNERCKRPAGNASYSKRIQKTVSQRKLKLSLDVNVSEIFSIESFHKLYFADHIACLMAFRRFDL